MCTYCMMLQERLPVLNVCQTHVDLRKRRPTSSNAGATGDSAACSCCVWGVAILVVQVPGSKCSSDRGASFVMMLAESLLRTAIP